jgi:hypothetical protein
MIVKQYLNIALLAGVLGCASCAANQPVKPDAAGFETAYAAAEAARKKAASVEGEWRDTGKLMKSAKAAAEQGDYEKAIKLANQAKHQGEMGYKQAVEQKGVGLPSYITGK